MTTLTIKSGSKKKTLLLMQLAEELGLSAEANDFEELNVDSMAMGIGRKVTDGELRDYLAKGATAVPIDLE